MIGGLKCGTTSLHHYLNLHPQIAMSRPKELNFFVAELNWELGPEWYASHFDRAAAVRGESSPHYTNLPRFAGVAERMRELLGGDARLIYMVRDPIERMLSHYLHNVGGGYESRPLEAALADPDSAYVARSRYAMQLEPYLSAFERERVLIVANEELRERARGDDARACSSSAASTPAFSSEQFEREWETGSGKQAGGFRLMDRAVRLPGPAGARSQLRPPAGVAALAGRAARPRPRHAAPRRSPSSTRPLRAPARASCCATTSPSSSGSPGRSFGWLAE